MQPPRKTNPACLGTTSFVIFLAVVLFTFGPGAENLMLVGVPTLCLFTLVLTSLYRAWSESPGYISDNWVRTSSSIPNIIKLTLVIH